MKSYVGSLLALGAAATFALSGCATANPDAANGQSRVPSNSNIVNVSKKHDLNGIWYMANNPIRIEQTGDSFVGYRMKAVGFHPEGFRVLTGSVKDNKVYCHYFYPFGGSHDIQSQLSEDGNTFYCRSSNGRHKVQRAE